jgi:signal transduction histidine kinase
MLGRVYSLALAAITIEALVNGYRQLSYLNQPVFFFSAVVFISAVIGVVITQWFYSDGKFWLQVVPIIALLGLVTWPLHFQVPASLSDNFYPWVWWTLGIASVAAGTSYRFSIGVGYVALVSAWWFVFRLTPVGGSATLIEAAQNALQLLLFPSILIAMVLALRWEAGKVDSANQLAVESAVESARVGALELERSRMDALVHDSVLTTLLVASRAQTPEQIESAKRSAQAAIDKLKAAAAESSTDGEMTLASFFNSLAEKVKDQAPKFDVSVDRLHDLPIPAPIAQALSEATLQAVDNAQKHAPDATDYKLRLRGQKRGVKIVISDNGGGFRPSQIPKDRLGIRSSIIGRVEGVGGRVFINSSPRSGASVIIEWGQND